MRAWNLVHKLPTNLLYDSSHLHNGYKHNRKARPAHLRAQQLFSTTSYGFSEKAERLAAPKQRRQSQ